MFGTTLRRDPVRPAVVVADDDPAMREFLSHTLTHAGYHTYTAMDISQAIDRVVRPGVAAVIVDMLYVNSGTFDLRRRLPP